MIKKIILFVFVLLCSKSIYAKNITFIYNKDLYMDSKNTFILKDISKYSFKPLSNFNSYFKNAILLEIKYDRERDKSEGTCFSGYTYAIVIIFNGYFYTIKNFYDPLWEMALLNNGDTLGALFYSPEDKSVVIGGTHYNPQKDIDFVKYGIESDIFAINNSEFNEFINDYRKNNKLYEIPMDFVIEYAKLFYYEDGIKYIENIDNIPKPIKRRKYRKSIHERLYDDVHTDTNILEGIVKPLIVVKVGDKKEYTFFTWSKKYGRVIKWEIEEDEEGKLKLIDYNEIEYGFGDYYTCEKKVKYCK